MKRPCDPKHLWMGAVEVRALERNNDILEDAKGAFVNIIAWASDVHEYRHNAELIMSKLGLFISEVLAPEPVESRRRTGVGFAEEIEDMISRAQDNRNAIIYGTFHLFREDNA
jgi:hypothetical protein